MKIVLNDHAGATTFEDALSKLTKGAETLSLAVSYLQVGGWELFRRHTRGLRRRQQPRARARDLELPPTARARVVG